MFSQLYPLTDMDYTPLNAIKLQGRVIADSRNIKKGDIFIAYPGEYSDGRDYIESAVKQGAMHIIYDSSDDFHFPEQLTVPNTAIDNLRARAGIIAAYLLGQPSLSIPVVGVTGTNGKTSITQWLAQALELLGYRCGLIGTVGNGFLGQLQASTHTTPDAVTLQNILSDLVINGAKAATIEVSSHGLDQFRINGVAFHTAIFTNLTRDHFDYHKTIEEYAEVKSRLFFWQNLQHAIINIDDVYGQKLFSKLKQEIKNIRVTSYGFNPTADIHIKDYHLSLSGTEILLVTPAGEVLLKSLLLGRFNAQNIAASIAALWGMGHPLESIAAIWSQIRPAKGRMDCMIQNNMPLVVVDYAHTPDALKNALLTLQELKSQNSRLWCVFGCGGNRDKGKRPLMGEVASEYADYAVVTSDNPRYEDPQQIIDDILSSVENTIYVDVSRQQAIEYAIKSANLNDIILIAGKGHENYQDIQGVKQHFDDFEEAQQALAQRKAD